jgi:hypothetical protein
MLIAEILRAREGNGMDPIQWPWSWEEETEWEQELQQGEFVWMDELIDHMVSDSLAGSGYDPLHAQDDWAEEETSVF